MATSASTNQTCRTYAPQQESSTGHVDRDGCRPTALQNAGNWCSIGSGSRVRHWRCKRAADEVSLDNLAKGIHLINFREWRRVGHWCCKGRGGGVAHWCCICCGCCVRRDWCGIRGGTHTSRRRISDLWCEGCGGCVDRWRCVCCGSCIGRRWCSVGRRRRICRNALSGNLLVHLHILYPH